MENQIILEKDSFKYFNVIIMFGNIYGKYDIINTRRAQRKNV